MTDNSNSRASGYDRRAFMTGAVAGAAVVPLTARGAGAEAKGAPTQDASLPVDVTLRINGDEKRLTIDSRTTLLDAMREHLNLTGSKKGCDHGQCGACTVLVGGERVLSCLTLAASLRGPVTTIEGLAPSDDKLHPMQQAFLDQDAFQCGYCT